MYSTEKQTGNATAQQRKAKVQMERTIASLNSIAAGSRYGPPGSKRLVYFIDDCNMPLVDKYDTQSAIELMRQAIDYRGWYDKVTPFPSPNCF